MKKTTKPYNNSHTITKARRTDHIPLICTSAGPIHPVHRQPMLLATEAMPETRLHCCHFPAVLPTAQTFGYFTSWTNTRRACLVPARIFTEAAAFTIHAQAFWQESGNDRACFLVGCVKKSRAARFWNAVSAAKIWKPYISSVQEKALSGILYKFCGVFILAKTRCLELSTNNLLTRTHS